MPHEWREVAIARDQYRPVVLGQFGHGVERQVDIDVAFVLRRGKVDLLEDELEPARAQVRIERFVGGNVAIKRSALSTLNLPAR
jgi:hypothetical protein